MNAPVYSYRYTAIFIIMLLLSLIIHVGGSLELALMSYRAMVKALQELIQPPASFDQTEAEKKTQEEKDKTTDKWIVSQRKYGTESGLIWVEDDTIALPEKIPAQQQPASPPAITPTPAKSPTQKKLPISAQEAAKVLQDLPTKNPEEMPTEKEEIAEKNTNPTQLINSDLKHQHGYEKLLPNLLKQKSSRSSKVKVQSAHDKNAASTLSLQSLQEEFSSFTHQRQAQQAFMLIPKGNDRFTSKSMYVEELPPEQQIRMDSYMRRMVWLMDNIGKSMPMLRLPNEAIGISKLTAQICLQLDRKGNIIKLELEKSCGYKEFDERALLVFKEAKNFGDLPNFYTPSLCTQHWGFSFIPQVVSQY